MIARILTGCALLGCIAFGQESNRKPGLWETSVTQQMPGMPGMEERLAQMPPAQRAQFEAIMKSRMGPGAQPTVTKSCETPETLKREMAYGQDGGKTCKITTVSATGSKRVLQLNCENANMKSEGTATIESPDSEHFTGTVQMHVNSQGRSMDVTQKISGKWLGSDCGDVKPRELAK
jgi:hypothetical protein